MTINASGERRRVYVEKREGVARIYLSNPDRYNAMSLSMWRELARLIQDADADPAVRVLLLMGAGEKAFVSGADISEFALLRDTPAQVEQYAEAVKAAQQGLSACGKPVIAGIRGICMGGGIGLALACDLRYANQNARFRMPAAKMGLGYDLEGIQRAVDVLGAARTADLFFTARDLDGLEAERIGLVHKSFADAQFSQELEAIASGIAANAPLTLHAVKLALRHALNDPSTRDAATVNQAIQACFDSTDYKEGQQAFREKRPPKFCGQ